LAKQWQKGGWTLLNAEIAGVFCSPNIAQVMREARSAHREQEKYTRILVGKPAVKRPLARRRR
jgi:hypothetical protein